MVDMYMNPHIRDKTVLTIGDGLFGNWVNNWTEPTPWILSKNKASNSLLFATDPVAIDCVMADFLDAEYHARYGYGIPDMADDYLVLAENVGLGMYERGDPLPGNGSGYSRIQYARQRI
jgi:hypothetical protein